MSSYNQNQQALEVSYPAPGTAYPAQPQGGAYTAPPPPAGYPVRDSQGGYPGNTTDPTPAKTQSRGDGFWKGCCAALCCCCVLDACF